MLASPLLLDESVTQLRFDVEVGTFANLSSISLFVGETELRNCLLDVSGQFINCDAPELEAGEYTPSGSTSRGRIMFKSRQHFLAGLSVSSISPTSGGRFGGQLLTLSGFGFSEDTVVEFVKDGLILCSPCVIGSVQSSESMTVITPPVDADGNAKIFVRHEYIAAAQFVFDFTYSSTSLGSFTLSSGSLESLTGAENIELSKDAALDCSNMMIELTLAKSPCAEGISQSVVHLLKWHGAVSYN